MMSPNGNTPTERRRRMARYTAEYAAEPSMSAPQPMPTATAATAHGSSRRAEPLNAPVGEQTAGYDAYQPGPGAEAQPTWQQTYPQQPQQMQQGWSQGYAAVRQQTGPQGNQRASSGWQQENLQPQPGWQQTYPQQVQGSWQQAYSQQGWSQPYAGGSQEWQGTNGYAPQQPDLQAGAEHMAGRGGGSGGAGSNVVKLAIAAAAVIIIVVLAVTGGRTLHQSNTLHQAVSAYNDRFCEGVYVDGIHLGGMTQQEAVDAVTSSAQQRLQAWNVRLTYGEGDQEGLIRTITASDLGMTVNVNEALENAWAKGHESSSVEERKAAMDALLTDPYHGYTALPSGDTSAIDTILNDLASVVYSQPRDAKVIGFDPAAHSDPFVIESGAPGYYLDVEPVKQQIYSMVANMQSGSIKLQTQEVQPTVTEAMLRSQRTLRGSALTEISTTSTTERTANIERAFQLINGKVLKPGESFSFNNIVGARTAKNGFHEAIEYAYGNERMGYGGGVCQASTTIYLAAVRANMTITKREPHSDKVNYTDYGLDATVNYDGKKIDLTFKNTTNSDVYILTYLVRANGRWNCKVDIYGEAHEPGITYDLIAETVEILPAPVDPEYVEDKDGTHVMYIDDEPVVKRKASDGVIVETFKVKYLNGVEVERTYVARDTYKEKSQQLWVGVHEHDDLWQN